MPISVAIHNNRAKRANLLEKMKRKSLSDQGRSYGTLALPSVVTPTTTIHF